MRAQGVVCHRGHQLGERAGLTHQLAVWGCTRGKLCGIKSGSSVALIVERAVRVRMPLHWVPLRLCVCRVSSAIVDSDEEIKQDGDLVRVLEVTGHRGLAVNHSPR